MKQTVSASTFKTWFSGSYVLDLKKNADKLLLVVALKNNFQKEQLETRYLDQITKLAAKEGTALQIVFVVARKQPQETSSIAPIFTGVAQSSLPEWRKPESLRADYSFENFVVGPSNNLAYLAAKEVAASLGVRYNPLLIWGPTGVGKTHLLQAIGNEVTSSIENARAVYASSERFTNDYVESLRNKTQQAFRSKYRKADLVLIDDVQFLAGKESTQDEFFNTLNELLLSGRQAVIACDRHPKELGKLKERLVSRFLGGLTSDIGKPDFEMKMAILKNNCQKRGWSMPDEVATQIVENSSGVRELEGLLLSTMTALSLSGGKLSYDQLKESFVKTRLIGRARPSEESIMRAVCGHFKIRQNDLVGPSRKKRLVFARQVAMFLLRHEVSAPLEYIGQVLGNRDHSTIIYGISKVESLTKSDHTVNDEVLRVKELVNKES